MRNDIVEKEIKDMSADELLDEYDSKWNWITQGRDSDDVFCIVLSQLLSIERELTLREGE